jgi:hypothetical protein
MSEVYVVGKRALGDVLGAIFCCFGVFSLLQGAERKGPSKTPCFGEARNRGKPVFPHQNRVTSTCKGST